MEVSKDLMCQLKYISRFCENAECIECPFYDFDQVGCVLEALPNNWDLDIPVKNCEVKKAKISRSDILEDAKEIVTEKRSGGKSEDNFKDIAELWTAYLKFRPQSLITPEDVSIMMILLKIARINTGHGGGDNWVDICGYAACGGAETNE